MRSRNILFLLLIVVLLCACATRSTDLTEVIDITTQSSSATTTPTKTLKPTNTPTITTSPTSTQTPIILCSPLENTPLQQLKDLVSNPFNPPPLGSDDPHQGVDLADIDPVSRIALEGRQVQAITNGLVIGVITDRFPYGNALIIETPLDWLPADQQVNLALPTPGPIEEKHPVLTCPEMESPPNWNMSERSIYVLYGHLKTSSELTQGNLVNCGENIGTIGQSGNALNPHLHIEVRVGPAGARFDSMAHYTGNASLQEMYNYCQWRVSGRFQLVDPMHLFSHTTE